MSQEIPNFKPGDFVIFIATNELFNSGQNYPIFNKAEGVVIEANDISINHLCGYYIIEWTIPISGELVQGEYNLYYETFLHRNTKKYREIKINQLLT